MSVFFWHGRIHKVQHHADSVRRGKKQHKDQTKQNPTKGTMLKKQ